MSKPLVASVSHELGRREARQRIESGLDEIRTHLSTFATPVEEKWTEDRLDFRLIAFDSHRGRNARNAEHLARPDLQPYPRARDETARDKVKFKAR